jgi:hypothetical protein
VQSYREYMQQFVLMNHLDVWYFHLDLEGILAMARGMTGTKVIRKDARRYSERDYAALLAAIKKGRVQAQIGV